MVKRRRRGTRRPRRHRRKARRYDGGVEAVWLDDVMHYVRLQDRTAAIWRGDDDGDVGIGSRMPGASRWTCSDRRRATIGSKSDGNKVCAWMIG